MLNFKITFDFNIKFGMLDFVCRRILHHNFSLLVSCKLWFCNKIYAFFVAQKWADRRK
jgi:hypothetical protein